MPSRQERNGMRLGGMITAGVGVFFLLETLDVIPHIGKMWPVFPIIVGLSLLAASFGKPSSEKEDAD